MNTNTKLNPTQDTSYKGLSPLVLVAFALLVVLSFAFMFMYIQKGSTVPAREKATEARKVSAVTSGTKSGPDNNGSGTSTICASGWSCTQGASYPVNQSGEVSVDLDANQYPHVSTVQPLDNNTWKLEYSYMNETGWHTETAFTKQSERPLATSIHLDSLGNPHILVDVRYNSDVTSIYVPYNKNAQIYHLFKDANGWQSELVVSKTVLSTQTGPSFHFLFSSALDTADRLHVVYFDRHLGKFLYVYQGDTGWRSEEMENAREWNYFQRSSIDTDSSNNPHVILNKISYSQSSLVYMYKDASGWHSEDLGNNIVFDDNQIKLDTGNRPHILYTQGSYYNPQLAPPESLVYAYKDSSGWHTEQIQTDRNGLGIVQLSLDLDSRSLPHIAYDSSNFRCRGDQCGGVIYHYKDTDGWHRLVVEQAKVAWYSPAVRGVEINLDSRNIAHMVYTGSSVSGNLAGGFRYATRQ